MLYFAIFAAFKESMTLNLAHRSYKVIDFGGNRKPVYAASPLRNFFKESLTRGPLRLCVNEKTVRVNDSPYFQFKGHTVPPPIPIKIIIKIIKTRGAWQSQT